MYVPPKPGPLPPPGAEVLQWDQVISSQDRTSGTTQVSQAHALPVSMSLRSALLFTAALLPGPLVKSSSGITTCGSLSFFPDHFPPHPLCAASIPCLLTRGVSGPSANPALPVLCVPPVWSSGSVRSTSWLSLATLGTLPRHCALNVVWVARERAGDERPPCPLLGKQPPTGLPGGCLGA